MSSAKEQFLKFNTLSCLIGQCVGYVTTVELRNEAFVTGKVVEVDGFMYVSVRCFLSYWIENRTFLLKFTVDIACVVHHRFVRSSFGNENVLQGTSFFQSCLNNKKSN